MTKPTAAAPAATAPAFPDQTTAARDLMATERCDRCGAAAYVLVAVREPGSKVERPLGFCGHDFATHESGPKGIIANPNVRVVIDVRDRLLARESGVHA